MMTRRDWRGPPTLPKGGSLTGQVEVEDPAPTTRGFRRGLRWRPNGHRPYFQQQTVPSVPDPPLERHRARTHPPIPPLEESSGFAARLIGRPLRQCLRRLRDLSTPVFWYVELTLGVHLYLQDVDGACVLAEEHME